MLAIDASHAAMRVASQRAARPAHRGGLPNAVFIASSLEMLPPELNGVASLVVVHFPWGSLLRASTGQDASGAARLASMVAPGGTLRLLVSASDRDAARGAVDLRPEEVAAAYSRLGMRPVTCRVATLADVAKATSSWGKRLLATGNGRVAWLIELVAQSPAAVPSGKTSPGW